MGKIRWREGGRVRGWARWRVRWREGKREGKREEGKGREGKGREGRISYKKGFKVFFLKKQQYYQGDLKTEK